MMQKRTKWTLVVEGIEGPVPVVVRVRRLLKVAWRSMQLKAVEVTEEKPETPVSNEPKTQE